MSKVSKEELLQSLDLIDRSTQELRSAFVNPASYPHHIVERSQAVETDIKWFQKLFARYMEGK